MKTNYYYYLLIAVLALFNFLLIKQKLSNREEIKPETTETFEKNYKLQEIISVMTKNQNTLLLGEQILIDKHLDSLQLSQVIDTPQLIFFFNEYSCMPCVDKVIAILLSKLEDVGEGNIIILSHYNQLRDMYLFSQVNKLEVPIFNMTSKIEIPAAALDIPFVFTTDKDLKVNNLLLVDQSLLDLVESYIEILIENNFFSDKI